MACVVHMLSMCADSQSVSAWGLDPMNGITMASLAV